MEQGVELDQESGGYSCLVDQQFIVGREVYVVSAITVRKTHTVVEAHLWSDMTATRRFFLADVLERLLVEEEIELFSPNYLGRALKGSAVESP